NEGDTVTQGQLIGVIEPSELQADSAYYAHSVAGMASEVEESQAALRYEQRQGEDQIQHAEAKLAPTIAQQAEALPSLDSAKINFERIQTLSKEGLVSVQQLDQARTEYDAAKAHVEALNKQVEAQRAAVALARAGLEQVGVKQGQLSANVHQRAAAAAQKSK